MHESFPNPHPDKYVWLANSWKGSHYYFYTDGTYTTQSLHDQKDQCSYWKVESGVFYFRHYIHQDWVACETGENFDMSVSIVAEWVAQQQLIEDLLFSVN